MKTKILSHRAAIVLLTVMLCTAGCQKQKTDLDFTTASNQALGEESYNDVNNVADEASQTGDVSYKTVDDNSILSCATVTRDTVSMPHTTIVDFGAGCTGTDGKTRKGKILISYDGPYRATGTTITVTFDQYFVNDNQVLGTKTIHNDGPNNAGNLSFTIHVDGQLILSNGEGTITWVSERQREWIAGEATLTRNDDQYSVTGTASGTAANGNQFTATVQQALIRNLAPGCRKHFVQGVVLINVSGKPDRTLDFGSGSCDDLAVITINGQSHTITLHR